MSEAIKYTRIEYERRFLVSPHSDWRALVEPYSKTFTDTYLRQTRLRLRILVDSDSGRRALKLTKKFESDSPYFQMIGSHFLTPAGFEILSTLRGHGLRKVRYFHRLGEQLFSIDEFQDELAGLVLCEVERRACMSSCASKRRNMQTSKSRRIGSSREGISAGPGALNFSGN